MIEGDVRKQYLDDETKLKRHRQTIKVCTPMIFCVRCGATTVDQNNFYELRCYECGTTLSWDASKFSVRRHIEKEGEFDVIGSFRAAHNKPEK